RDCPVLALVRHRKNADRRPLTGKPDIEPTSASCAARATLIPSRTRGDRAAATPPAFFVEREMHNRLCKSLPLAFVFIVAAALILPARAQQAQNLPVCPLIATGGTIAMKIDPVKQAPVPAISGEDLLATVPEVANHARVEVKNISNIPSDYMDPVRWVGLTQEVNAALARPEVAGVIVSHGTDTLEETGYWLDLTVDSEK